MTTGIFFHRFLSFSSKANLIREIWTFRFNPYLMQVKIQLKAFRNCASNFICSCLKCPSENSRQNNLPTQDNDVSEGPLDMSIKKKPRLSSPPPYRPPGQASPTQSSQDRTCPPPPSYESSRGSSNFTVSSTRPDIGCTPRWRGRSEEDTRPIREITIITGLFDLF